MCGIAGVYEHVRSVPVDAGVTEAMLEVITHRGPDDQGVLRDGAFEMGMRRLSIIDLAGGAQPIWSEDRRYAVVCNGEIYNYRQLQRELRSRGHHLSTDSDTEVIVHLYEDLGAGCVDRLRGMFAFAIWDSHLRKLFLARDRLGIKPLYWSDAAGCIVFGSEVKSLLRHPRVVASPSMQGMSDFLSLMYVPAPQTMFEGINALPPGCTLTCADGKVVLERYWDVSFRPRSGPRPSDADYIDELSELLREAVRLHLRSDVPFGAFLSGGVDSSTIVALMTQLLDRPVKTFAVGFDGADEAISELPYARLVATRFGCDHHELFVRAQHLIDLAETTVWHLDQPIADEAVLASHMLAHLASSEVKMVLTGEGGDELFAGYPRYAAERFSPLFAHLPDVVRRRALAVVLRLPQLRRIKTAAYALCQPDELSRLTNWSHLLNPSMKESLLAPAFAEALAGATSAEHVIADAVGQSDAANSFQRMLYVDTKLWLPDDLLARGDKTSMAASIEGRVPLLDHHVVEFAAALPDDLKLRRLKRKWLLKQVAAQWVPQEVIDRKKKGFPMPLAAWFRGEARPFMRDVLSSSAIAERGLFQPAYVERLLHEHESGFANHSRVIWALLSIELWFRLFIDGQLSTAVPTRSAPMHSRRPEVTP